MFTFKQRKACIVRVGGRFVVYLDNTDKREFNNEQDALLYARDAVGRTLGE